MSTGVGRYGEGGLRRFVHISLAMTLCNISLVRTRCLALFRTIYNAVHIRLCHEWAELLIFLVHSNCAHAIQSSGV
jgi:hypothetical protein